MKRFIAWFNDTASDGKNPLPALTRTAIAHLYFVCIHPFEDGDGRILLKTSGARIRDSHHTSSR